MPFLLTFLAALSTIVGGLLFFHPGIARMDNRYILGLASGVIISTTFFELIPEANVVENSIFLALGFFIFYLLEKLVMLHSCGEKECEAHNLGWIAAIGMALDNVIDGVGIAIGYLADHTIGLVMTIAVILHELPQGITTTVLMKEAGFRLKGISFTLIIAGGMYPLGAYLSQYIPQELYETTIAFVAGTFLYIGTGDLLTEAHRTFNVRVILSVMAGAFIPLGLESLMG